MSLKGRWASSTGRARKSSRAGLNATARKANHTNAKTRVLIVDDDDSIRRFLSDAFGLEDDMEVVGAAPDAIVGIEEARRTHPDVILLDFQMPGQTGAEAIPGFREAAHGCKIILYSAMFEVGDLPAESPQPDVCMRKGVDPVLIIAMARLLAAAESSPTITR